MTFLLSIRNLCHVCRRCYAHVNVCAACIDAFSTALCSRHVDVQHDLRTATAHALAHVPMASGGCLLGFKTCTCAWSGLPAVASSRLDVHGLLACVGPEAYAPRPSLRSRGSKRGAQDRVPNEEGSMIVAVLPLADGIALGTTAARVCNLACRLQEGSVIVAALPLAEYIALGTISTRI